MFIGSRNVTYKIYGTFNERTIKMDAYIDKLRRLPTRLVGKIKYK